VLPDEETGTPDVLIGAAANAAALSTNRNNDNVMTSQSTIVFNRMFPLLVQITTICFLNERFASLCQRLLGVNIFVASFGERSRPKYLRLINVYTNDIICVAVCGESHINTVGHFFWRIVSVQAHAVRCCRRTLLMRCLLIFCGLH